MFHTACPMYSLSEDVSEEIYANLEAHYALVDRKRFGKRLHRIHVCIIDLRLEVWTWHVVVVVALPALKVVWTHARHPRAEVEHVGVVDVGESTARTSSGVPVRALSSHHASRIKSGHVRDSVYCMGVSDLACDRAGKKTHACLG